MKSKRKTADYNPDHVRHTILHLQRECMAHGNNSFLNL